MSTKLSKLKIYNCGFRKLFFLNVLERSDILNVLERSMKFFFDIFLNLSSFKQNFKLILHCFAFLNE